jgi:hypothetical protein
VENKTRRSNGEGHVQRVGDAWRGYRTIQGHRVYRRRRTRQEVVNKLRILDHEVLPPGRDPITTARTKNAPEQVTVALWLSGWHHRHGTWLKASTARRYGDLIRLHIVPIIGELRLDEVKYSTIDGLGINSGRSQFCCH